MTSSTASRSSFLVQTKIGPAKSSGTGSPLLTSKSSPLPISCNALPTRPPPTMTAGTTLVVVEAIAFTQKCLRNWVLKVADKVVPDKASALAMIGFGGVRLLRANPLLGLLGSFFFRRR